MRNKTYKVYGRDKGSNENPRYLFTTSGYNRKEAIKHARLRVKGAKTITSVVWYSFDYLLLRLGSEPCICCGGCKPWIAVSYPKC